MFAIEDADSFVDCQIWDAGDDLDAVGIDRAYSCKGDVVCRVEERGEREVC